MKIRPDSEIPRVKRPIDAVLLTQFPREERWIRGQTPPWRGVVQSLFKQMGGWRCYHTKRSDGSKSGFPDLNCVHPASGTNLYAELKIEGGTVSPDQRDWLLDLAACEEHVYLWYPSDRDEIDAVLRRAHERAVRR